MSDDQNISEILLLWDEARQQGQPASAEDLCRDCRELLPEVQRRIAALQALYHVLAEDSNDPLPPRPTKHLAPLRLGRYRVTEQLGEGGFGIVYKGRDEDLRRDVAIKVPHRQRLANPEDADTFLVEAQVVASLDHLHIVPVLDLGRTADGLCYVVSKFIEGGDLNQRLQQTRFSFVRAADLVAAVAEALHYAHGRGLVHRDIKPGNILLDGTGKPYVADFGLALKEVDYGKGTAFAGTPAYMSPEQARGEGHRVDGRSDIFSLGVVFYQILTGRLPFRGDSLHEVMQQITRDEARPPRQLDDAIPKELERICLKGLAKRTTDRYTTAKDMAADLRHFLAHAAEDEKSRTVVVKAGAETPAAPTPIEGKTPTPTSDPPPVKIVPKGLRAFDAHDADFFLELLPGPRDRNGLPDSLRFWKTRIEEVDPDSTFAVGLLYGPSGCGKTSLVRAGLLPRLANSVVAVYVEANADDTETRLLKGLRKHCPEVPDALGLIETLASLRRGFYRPAGNKVVLILDQFEQWLHAKGSEANTELVQALRHCDGGGVQCLVLVRDDFGMAATRFMGELDIPIVQGHNFATVDLFDLLHARKVLAEFGRAFGRLPDNLGTCTKEQQAFLDRAVAGLSLLGKVISVRLALFAALVKGKPWTQATLRAVGGMEGVGVTFLEETFAASTASPQHRLHQKAAQAVLRALLPEIGTDIKGNMRSQQELLVASGYAGQPKEFAALLRILDGELRLITPTDPEGKEEGERMKEEPEKLADSSFILPPSSFRFYQLTHDYLVQSLRDWLTRKQKETRRGRAELLLAERAAAWNHKPEQRHLPAWWEWARIRLFTRKRDWTPPQRRMMRRAGPYHGVRGLLVLALVGLTVAGWWTLGAREARARVENLLTAKTADVLDIAHGLEPYRPWATPLLREALADAERDGNKRRQLHASLALLAVDNDQVKYLKDRLLHGDPEEIPIIRKALFEHRHHLTAGLWQLLENLENDRDQRFRAACALAEFAPDDPRWDKTGNDVAGNLVALKPFEMARWTEVFKPVRKALLPPLAGFLEDDKRTPAERALIANIYAYYAVDVSDAYSQLEKQLAEKSVTDALVEKKLELTKKQANIAVGLLVMDRGDKVWPLLKQSPDPTLRSYLIERLGPGGVDSRMLFQRLKEEKEDSIRRALLLSLGGIGPDRLPPVEQQNLLPRILDLYRDDPNPGIHGAARWLLKQWRAEDQIKRIDEANRGVPVAGVKRRWFVNGQGQTMVLIPKPGAGWFWMGESGEQHRQPLDRDFTLSSEDVTIGQFLQFYQDKRKDVSRTNLNAYVTILLQNQPLAATTCSNFLLVPKEYNYDKMFAPTQDCPAINVTWYEATEYCNWLSKREGIAKEQWCYEPNQYGQYAAGMKIKADYSNLKGYRLPTEAEWEYACRAGSTVSYSFGESGELLERYGWFSGNAWGKAHPCGTLKPNDLGLFDMHGNVWQWTQSRFDNFDNKRVMRGGSWFYGGESCRAANRLGRSPNFRIFDHGIRLARASP